MSIAVSPRGSKQNGRRRPSAPGFTLIELLTVIAIIAVLAAVMYPVMSIARANARKSGCRNNMNTIIQALKMYYDDWGVYPDSLMGIEYGAPTVAPAPGAQAFAYRLGREYVKDDQAFTCPDHPQALKNSDTLVQPTDPRTGSPAVDIYGRSISFLQRDSYDVQYRPNIPAAGTPLLNYSRKWTNVPSGLSDSPRQLVYRNAPDSTVVTWCLNHSHQNASGVPEKGGMAVVAFLSGRVQDLPAEKLQWPPLGAVEPWLVSPKP